MAVVTAASAAVPFHRDSLAVPESAKFTVTRDDYPGLHNPNPRGWYYKCANVVQAGDGSLVACWQLSDQHTSLTSWIMVARSTDGGRTWGEHRTIAQANVWEHRAIWVVPQMSVLRDGRLVIVCDRGQRSPGQNMPMLSDWQKPDRGMSNWIFWRALRVRVENDARDYSIDWRWTPADGYPDQFRRDRTVVLDYAYPAADCGYSSWTQLPDGKIVIVDYTNLRQPGAAAAGEHPRNLIRAYRVTEADLMRGPGASLRR